MNGLFQLESQHSKAQGSISDKYFKRNARQYKKYHSYSYWNISDICCISIRAYNKND
jgi:hypothetical protein